MFGHRLPVLYAIYPVPSVPLPEAWAGLRDAELAEWRRGCGIRPHPPLRRCREIVPRCRRPALLRDLGGAALRNGF
jgi:hypothetical protein